MKLLWWTLQFVLSRKKCPHWDSLYCNCAADRRRKLAARISERLRAQIPIGKQDMADEMNAVLDAAWRSRSPNNTP